MPDSFITDDEAALLKPRRGRPAAPPLPLASVLVLERRDELTELKEQLRRTLEANAALVAQQASVRAREEALEAREQTLISGLRGLCEAAAEALLSAVDRAVERSTERLIPIDLRSQLSRTQLVTATRADRILHLDHAALEDALSMHASLRGKLELLMGGQRNTERIPIKVARLAPLPHPARSIARLASPTPPDRSRQLAPPTPPG